MGDVLTKQLSCFLMNAFVDLCIFVNVTFIIKIVNFILIQRYRLKLNMRNVQLLIKK